MVFIIAVTNEIPGKFNSGFSVDIILLTDWHVLWEAFFDV